MLRKQLNYSAELMDDGMKLSEEIVVTAQQKLTCYNVLKGEIDTGMARVHEALDDVRKKIIINCQSEQNRDGLLTGKEVDYLQCLEMDYRKLEQLLRQDEEKWAENIRVKKREA